MKLLLITALCALTFSCTETARPVAQNSNAAPVVKNAERPQTAIDIRRAFGGKKEQDIEWGILGGRIFIVQARPYIDKK